MKLNRSSNPNNNNLQSGMNSSSNIMNPLGRLQNANNIQMNNQMSSQQQAKSNLNLNLMQQQNIQQSISSPQNLIGSANANNNLNNMILNNTNIQNGQTLNPSPQPQVQNQLIESLRLAVSSNLISADLFNTKLPQEVLTLLYQRPQTTSRLNRTETD